MSDAASPPDSAHPPDAPSTAEPPNMLEPHAPHEPIHTWKGFLIHIGAIAVGLLLALGLEQTVEAIHHDRQRGNIERSLRSTLEKDLKIDANTIRQLRSLRAYLSELLDALNARLQGHGDIRQPPPNDSRVSTFLLYPGLAPYDTALKNGTVALLSEDRIALYSRLSFVRDLLIFSRDRWVEQTEQLEAFQKRYVNSPGVMVVGAITTAPDVRTLSVSELTEYRQLVATTIERTDDLQARMDLIDLQMGSILTGTTAEEKLFEDSIRARPHGLGVTDVTPGAPPSQP